MGEKYSIGHLVGNIDRDEMLCNIANELNKLNTNLEKMQTKNGSLKVRVAR